MSCYHPFIGIPDYDAPKKENNKRTYIINGSYEPEMKRLYPGAISIPCGKCIGCRLDYSRAWADRMMLELDHTKKAIFVTLTYDNDNVPLTEDDNGEFGWFSLYKPDLQKFFKRLRKYFGDKEIRFYAAGEYGDNTFRPHYHAIIFGLSLDDFPDRKIKGTNELKQAYYISDTLAKIWKNGFIMLCDVSWETCAYVARYVQKKVHNASNYLPEMYGAEKEFSLMSRRPGIGAKYMEDHPDMFEFSNLYVEGHGQSIAIPKYFVKKLELIDPKLYAKIKEQRAEFMKDRELLKMQQIELSFIEQLELEENKKLARTNALKRLL